MPAMTMLPMAATVAGDEPETAAKSMQARTEAMARPPRMKPTQSMAKRYQSVGHSSCREKGRGEDEEGDGQKRVVLALRLEKLQGDGGQRVTGEHEDCADARQAQRDGDGHARDQAEKKKDEQRCSGHVVNSPRWPFRRLIRFPRRPRRMRQPSWLPRRDACYPWLRSDMLKLSTSPMISFQRSCSSRMASRTKPMNRML